MVILRGGRRYINNRKNEICIVFVQVWNETCPKPKCVMQEGARTPSAPPPVALLNIFFRNHLHNTVLRAAISFFHIQMTQPLKERVVPKSIIRWMKELKFVSYIRTYGPKDCLKGRSIYFTVHSTSFFVEVSSYTIRYTHKKLTRPLFLTGKTKKCEQYNRKYQYNSSSRLEVLNLFVIQPCNTYIRTYIHSINILNIIIDLSYNCFFKGRTEKFVRGGDKTLEGGGMCPNTKVSIKKISFPLRIYFVNINGHL